MSKRWSVLPALLVILLAACGSGATSSHTPSPQSTTQSNGGTEFTGCGSPKYTEPEPPRPSAGQPLPTPINTPISQADVLAGVHQSILQAKSGIEAVGAVTCKIHSFTADQVAAILAGAPGTTSHIWVVIATGQFTVAGVAKVTGEPSLHASVVFFVGDHHPFTILHTQVYSSTLPSPLAGV